MDRNPKKHLSLRELPKEDRPQERLERLGPTPLTDRELLAMLVRSGNAKIDVLAIADELIKQAGSMTGQLEFGQKQVILMKEGLGMAVLY